MSLTRSQLSHPGGAQDILRIEGTLHRITVKLDPFRFAQDIDERKFMKSTKTLLFCIFTIKIHLDLHNKCAISLQGTKQGIFLGKKGPMGKKGPRDHWIPQEG